MGLSGFRGHWAPIITPGYPGGPSAPLPSPSSLAHQGSPWRREFVVAREAGNIMRILSRGPLPRVATNPNIQVREIGGAVAPRVREPAPSSPFLGVSRRKRLIGPPEQPHAQWKIEPPSSPEAAQR